MKVYRPLLIVLTILVAVIIGITLLSSWTKPQAQSQLDLYQSDLLLQAAEWESLDQEMQGLTTLRTSFFGESPAKDALENYQTVRKSVQKALSQTPHKVGSVAEAPGPTATERPNETRFDDASESPVALRSPAMTPTQLVDELDLRLGLLYWQTGDRTQALQTWTQLSQSPQAQANQAKTAQVLLGLWSDPPRLLPNAEPILNQNLNGWFRFQALSQLYRLQQRPDASRNLDIAEQQTAQSAFLRLLLVGSAPVFGSLVGVGIFIVWGLRAYFTQPKGSANAPPVAAALPAESFSVNGVDAGTSAMEALSSAVVWPTETIWQVMVLWFTAFFSVSFLLMPLLMEVLGVSPEAFSSRMQTYFALLNYGGLMVLGWIILHWSLRPYIPNLLRWLKLRWAANWISWGLGGYFVALPLVLIISWLNQKLLQEQGGGNPILDIILHSHDGVTIGLLWFLVAVCAPLFEETLFRGFFLTSLTRYMPPWQAIGLSALLFAIAHLNLGDLLPLTLLGMVLGFVYWRSRNLLASMLLHSLWNSGSFIGLLVLGSSGS